MSPLQLTVRTILERAEAYEWSVQGFGLLRLYLRDDARLHIWDPELAYDNVSVIHDHSWDLESTIVVGRMTNIRYEETQGPGDPYHKQSVVTGYKAHLLKEPENVVLEEYQPVIYIPGDVYSQKAAEIHQSVPDPYTVTFMKRKADIDGVANLYWPYGTSWGTAKPRKATEEEVFRASLRVLEKHYAT
jgi:hypothetical protein